MKNAFWRSNNPIVWGLFSSALVVVGFAYLLVFGEVCEVRYSLWEICRPRWAAFISSTPNEIGDAIAGFSGSLAFIWLITTVWLQSQELAAQREELRLTRKEFHRMTGVQEKQADLMETQTALLTAERLGASEIQFGQVADQKLDELFSKDCSTFKSGINLVLEDGSALSFSPFEYCPKPVRNGAEVAILDQSILLQTALNCFDHYHDLANESEITSPSFELVEIQDHYFSALKYLERSDEVTKEKYSGLGIEHYQDNFRISKNESK